MPVERTIRRRKLSPGVMATSGCAAPRGALRTPTLLAPSAAGPLTPALPPIGRITAWGRFLGKIFRSKRSGELLRSALVNMTLNLCGFGRCAVDTKDRSRACAPAILHRLHRMRDWFGRLILWFATL